MEHTISCRVFVAENPDLQVISGSKTLSSACTEGTANNFTFALKNGRLEIIGVFIGNACKPNRLDYQILNDAIFLDLNINYEDTCQVAHHGFCAQTINTTIDNCNAEKYTVYFGHYANLTVGKAPTRKESKVKVAQETFQPELRGNDVVRVVRGETLDFHFLQKCNSFSLYDALGKRIVRKQTKGATHISIAGLQPGLYIYDIQMDGQRATGKVIR